MVSDGRAPCPHWPPCCLHYERSFYPPPATNLSFDAIHRQWILVQRPKVCLDCTPPRTRGRWKWWVPASGDAQPTVRLAANAFLVPTSPLGAATTAAPSNACTQIVRTRSSIMHMTPKHRRHLGADNGNDAVAGEWPRLYQVGLVETAGRSQWRAMRPSRMPAHGGAEDYTDLTSTAVASSPRWCIVCTRPQPDVFRRRDHVVGLSTSVATGPQHQPILHIHLCPLWHPFPNALCNPAA
jgi:hypothetical protein